jgi:hypothetical protein
MKKADLVVGGVYYVDGSNDWRNGHPSEGHRITLLDTTGWERYSGFFHSDLADRHYKLENGEEVKVPYYIRHDGRNVLIRYYNGNIGCVPTNHIRGEWEATHELVSANYDAYCVAWERNRSEQERQSAKREQVRATLKGYGLDATPLGSFLTLSEADVDRLLDLLGDTCNEEACSRRTK